MTISPGSQTVSAGGTASWTVSVTNTGGAYLYAVALSDPGAPACGSPPSSDSDTLYFLPPNLTVTYSCSVSGVGASFTNTVTATATTAPGPTITASASGSVSVQGSAPASAPLTPPVAAKTTGKTALAKLETLSVSGLGEVVLNVGKPKLHLHVKVSGSSELTLELVNAKGHKLAEWRVHVKSGTTDLSYLLPSAARHKGHEKLRISGTGGIKLRTLNVILIA